MYKVIRFEEDSNIYMIVSKEGLELQYPPRRPLEIYGFLRVNGKDYYTSTVSYKNIVNEAHKDLENLEEQAKLDYFQVD